MKKAFCSHSLAFPIVLDPLLWLSFVSTWIGCSSYYSLSVIDSVDWFCLPRCLLILYYILFFFSKVCTELRGQLHFCIFSGFELNEPLLMCVPPHKSSDGYKPMVSTTLMSCCLASAFVF